MLVMDLWKIIPENRNWTISKNIVYSNYLAKIPMLVKQGDDVWIYLELLQVQDTVANSN